MKHIQIIELGNGECSNVGVISTSNLDKFKDAIEAHFDAEMIGYTFDGDITSLDDCISAYPINVTVILNDRNEWPCRETHANLELSETWLYL